MSWGSYFGGIFDAFLGKRGQVTTTSKAGWTGYGNATARLLEDSYNRHGVIRAVIKEINTSFSLAPLEVGTQAGPDPVEDFKPLAGATADDAKALLQAHPVYPYHEMCERMINAAFLTGVNFNEIIPAGRSYRTGPRVVELWPLVTSHVFPILSKERGHPVKHFEVTRPGGGKMRTVATELIAPFGFPNPALAYGYSSPVGAVFFDSCLSQDLLTFVGEMINNPDLTGGTIALNENYSIDMVKRYMEMIEDQNAKDGTGKVTVVAGEYTPPAELEKYNFEQLEHRLESRVAAAVGVPPIVASLGVGLRRSTYSNYKTARRAFQQETMEPIFRMVEECLSRAVFGLNQPITYRFLNRELTALNADRETLGQKPGDGGDDGDKGGRPPEDGLRGEGGASPS